MPDLRLARLWRKTVMIVLPIVAITMACDYLFNVLLMPGVQPYTPLATLLIVLLIAPPFTHALVLQTDMVRTANENLNAERAARAAVEAANEAKSRFLANMSHELRTPLNAVIGYAEIIEEQCEHGQELLRADAAKISAAGRHLLDLVNSVLDLAKIEAGKLSPDAEDFELPALLDEVVTLVRPLAHRNGSVITLHIESTLPACATDRGKLRQCLVNLVGNAAKFTRDGTITISAAGELRDGAPWLAIDVRDTGIGMGPETLARIFRPFEQGDGSLTRRFEGTGLGLAITRQLVEFLGGAIHVESTPGVGSTFRLEVPAWLNAAGAEARAA